MSGEERVALLAEAREQMGAYHGGAAELIGRLVGGLESTGRQVDEALIDIGIAEERVEEYAGAVVKAEWAAADEGENEWSACPWCEAHRDRDGRHGIGCPVPFAKGLLEMYASKAGEATVTVAGIDHSDGTIRAVVLDNPDDVVNFERVNLPPEQMAEIMFGKHATQEHVEAIRRGQRRSKP